jgi:hypothetical protein
MRFSGANVGRLPKKREGAALGKRQSTFLLIPIITHMNTTLKLKLFGLTCLTFLGGTVFGIYLVSANIGWFIPELSK